MSNRILQVQVRDHSLDPAQAEVWIGVIAKSVTPTTELRGRLTGPRCVHAATVEIAYPFLPLVRRPEGTADLTVRVVVPEPSLWEPVCPFLYEGTVELWENGHRCDQAAFRHGLRRVALGPRGLRINGGPLFLNGRNLMLVSLETAPDSLWDRADWQGSFVLGRLKDARDATLQRAAALAAHPSCLGWLLCGRRESWDERAIRRLHGRGLIGVEWDAPPSEPWPPGVDFVACSSDLAAGSHRLGLPALLLDGGAPVPGVFGTVE